MTEIVRLSDRGQRKGRVYFNRGELMHLLALYSRHVAAGEWRDYAIDHAVGIAVFSIYRHSQDRPIYAFAKVSNRQTVEYAVYDTRRRLYRGHSLIDVVAKFQERTAGGES